MSNYTEAEALAFHGIHAGGQYALVDNARAAGLIYVCLECASVGGIDPEAPLGNHASFEAARQATRDHAPEGTWECCGETVVY